MSLDNDLDRIAIYISKLNPHDSFKEALENEYRLYRDILESVPVDANPPDRLPSSIYSLTLRLKNYVVFGTSNNPLVPVAHSIVKDITLDEKEELLKEVNTNPTFLATKKQKVDILKGYLNNIDFRGKIDDIRSTIYLVIVEYQKCNIHSNELEQEIAKAKYYYIIRLMTEGLIEEATRAIQDYDTDMILFIHLHHKETVDTLLKQNKATLANEIYHFLNEYQDDQIYNIDFWKVLTQIENPGFEFKDEKENDNEQEEQTEETSLSSSQDGLPKRRFFNLFTKTAFESDTFSIVVSPNDYINITLKLFKSYIMVEKEFRKLKKCIEKIIKRFDSSFSEINITVENYDRLNSYNLSNGIHIKRVLNEIFNQFADNVSSYKRTLNLYEYSFGDIIPEGCFERTKITKIVLPMYVKQIGEKAFFSCEGLKEVILSEYNSLHTIGDSAFKFCESLRSIDLSACPLDKNGLGRDCFSFCERLKDVSLGVYIEIIPDECFNGCHALTNISLKNIEEVGSGAFYNCKWLQRVENTTMLRTIRRNAFYNCESLKNFSFPMLCGEEYELTIEDEAFANSGLKKVYIDAERLNLGEKVFKGSAVSKATIYTSATELPFSTFSDCLDLEEVRLPEYLECLDEKSFYDCKELKVIKLPKTLKRIGRECFKGCYSLKEINVPEKFETLGNDAFDDCVSLPKSIIDQFNQK